MSGSPTAKVDWNEPREVARWTAERICLSDLTSQCLWLRYTLDGPGFMLTPPNDKPRGGLWTSVATISREDAERIMQRGPRGWPALCRLSEKIEAVLKNR